MADESERRQAPRFAVELRVAVRHLGRPDETHEETIRNISSGGVFIDTSVGLPPGTPVGLDVVLDEDTVPVEGEVVRVEWEAERGSEGPSRGIAIAFRPGQDAVIERLVAKVRRAMEGDEG